mmetsp:Transcript_2838/g.17667  ORF Transcript_2838/g.17667 Transcript_2838/m.17667 type:complete len:92 (+) Transcript_2838:265-540(+)
MCTSCDLKVEHDSRSNKERLMLGCLVGWIPPSSVAVQKNVTYFIAPCKLNHPASSPQLIGWLAQELRLVVQVTMLHTFQGVLQRLEWKYAL